MQIANAKQKFCLYVCMLHNIQQDLVDEAIGLDTQVVQQHWESPDSTGPLSFTFTLQGPTIHRRPPVTTHTL